MEHNVKSLRKQFLTRLFVVLLIIVLATGAIQTFLINDQINNYLIEESKMLSQSIEHGIKSTDYAGESIEHQIDLKLLSYAYHIGSLLEGKSWESITNEELINIKDQLNITGITIMAEQDDDIVGVRSTDPNEIGFSFKKIGYIEGYNGMRKRLEGIPQDPSVISYQEEYAHVLPIAQSGSHTDEQQFFKYAYYVVPGTDYIINPFIEANEVYQYTAKVGPQTWIEKVMQENPYVIEIAVLNPLVYKDPELETKLYPPKKKLHYGSVNYIDENNHGVLIDMANQEQPKTVSFVEKTNGENVYKLFIPIDAERVIYAALDYGKIISPLYRHSIILIFSGLISVIGLFLITARFFNRIYENIQRIKQQVKSLEARDFTAKSNVEDGSELGNLSESANRMVDTLHKVLVDTSEHASQVQRLSLILEQDANQSVEKIYSVSMETTMKQREIVGDILDFLDQVEDQLKLHPNNKTEELLQKVVIMREVAHERAGTTTDFTLKLSDLITSLHTQSKELTDISNSLLRNIQQFKL